MTKDQKLSANHASILTRDFERLRLLDTCAVANSIELFQVRPRNQGFAVGTVRSQFPHFPPMLGYAVTARIRASSPPMSGRVRYDQMDFWNYVLSIPAPRVAVFEDAGHDPGMGALMGEVQAYICLALKCVGCVTNGAVRDLDAVQAAGFQLFSAGVAVSHSYARIVEFGDVADICGLRIFPGDLIHGDRHGIQTIPLSIAAKIPDVAANLKEKECQMISLCRSKDFSLLKLAQALGKDVENDL